MRYHEIYNVCMPPQKRREERYNIWVTLAVRPLSILITKLLVNTSIKPTTITKWSILSVVIGFFLISLSDNVQTSILGWLFSFYGLF